MNIIYIITGFGILFLLNAVSIFLVNFLNIALPAPILGMLILICLIELKLIPMKYIEDSAKLMLDHMGLFFVPLVVGIVMYLNVIKQNALPILITVMVSTFIIICATGLAVEYLIKRRKKAK